MTRLILSLDAMGGDFGPSVTVPAALQALSSNLRLHLLIVGNPDNILPFLKKVDSVLLTRLQIIPTKLVISGNMKSSQAIRSSYGTSMRVALELMNDGKVQGCVSAGNTGALMGLAKLLIKPLDGIERPALMKVIPNQLKSKTVVLDLGANLECDSAMLVQFAVMGTVIAEEVIGIAEPRVALLNIGEEDTKGLAYIRTASAILKHTKKINYIGYLEGNDFLTGKTDVMICDGFIGNVTLKTIEGIVRVCLSLLQSPKDSNRQSWWLKRLSYWLKSQGIQQFSYLSPDNYNGACLLGLRRIVIKSHGAANLQAFSAAIEQAVQAVQRQIPERIAERLKIVLPKSD